MPGPGSRSPGPLPSASSPPPSCSSPARPTGRGCACPWRSAPAPARGPHALGLAAAAAVLAAGLLATLAYANSSGRAPPALLAVVGLTGAGVLAAVRERLVRERDALRSYALTDPLTQIANRRSLLARAEYEIERHRRARRSFRW